MFVCLSVCLFRMAGQTAGPIETKLHCSHTHSCAPRECFWQGQCQGHSRMPARVTEVRNTRKATSSERSAHYVRTPAAATPSERNYSNEARRQRRRAASGAAASRTPSGGRVITASVDRYNLATCFPENGLKLLPPVVNVRCRRNFKRKSGVSTVNTHVRRVPGWKVAPERHAVKLLS